MNYLICWRPNLRSLLRVYCPYPSDLMQIYWCHQKPILATTCNQFEFHIFSLHGTLKITAVLRFFGSHLTKFGILKSFYSTMRMEISTSASPARSDQDVGQRCIILGVPNKNVKVSNKKVLENCLSCCAEFRYKALFFRTSGTFLWDAGTLFWDNQYVKTKVDNVYKTCAGTSK